MATGLQISALFRNLLNEAGVNWKKAVEYGEKFNQQVEDAEWLNTDSGIEFSRTFEPDITPELEEELAAIAYDSQAHGADPLSGQHN